MTSVGLANAPERSGLEWSAVMRRFSDIRSARSIESHIGEGLGCVDDMAQPCFVNRGNWASIPHAGKSHNAAEPIPASFN
jgi:hypothetical protein